MLTARDEQILILINRFGFLCARHVIKHFNLNERVAYRRLERMVGKGYLHRRRVLPGRPRVLLLTQKAVESVGTNHSRAEIRLATHEHDLLVADAALALAAKHNWEFETEREIRASKGARFARGHTPDAILLTKNGTKIALEVETSYKSVQRLEKIIRHYRRSEVQRVLFVCRADRQADRIREIAARAKADGLVAVKTAREVLDDGAKPG